MRALNNRFNKANWSAALNAAIVLVNGRLSPDLALSTGEQGLLMIVLTFMVVAMVPNAQATPAKS